jgi:acetyl esterase/lipase
VPSGLSVEAAQILSSLEAESVDQGVSLEDQRRAWDTAVAALPLPAGVVEQVERIGGVGCRRLSPVSTTIQRPILVWAHGGGLTTGSSVTHRLFAAHLAHRADVEVLVPDYRLLPEHGIDDAIVDLAAVLGAVVEATTVAPHVTGPRRIGIGGDSSGAALAISAVLSQPDIAHPIDGLVSLCGAFDATLTSPSIDEADDPQLSRPVLVQWQNTVSTVCDPADPRLSPMFADLASVPPVLALAAERDVWRDDSVRLAERLRGHQRPRRASNRVRPNPRTTCSAWATR